MSQMKKISVNSFIVAGGKTTRDFINKNKLYGNNYYTKEPDFLEVTQTNGKVSKIKIIDAKTSAEATRAAQDSGFRDLCLHLKYYESVPCEVVYAVPQQTATNTKFVKDVCIFAFGNVVPDPVDALCLLVTLT